MLTILKNFKPHWCIAVLLIFSGSTAFSQTLQGGQVYSSDFIIDNVPRNISFYMPVHYGSKDFYPLIIILHGSGENATLIAKQYGDIIHAYADTMNAVVLYPEAVDSKWRDKMEDSGIAKDSINDVGFINIMLTYFVQQYACDPARVFVMGFNNGGDMAYRVGCNITLPINSIAAFFIRNDASTKCSPPKAINLMDTKAYTPQAGKTPYNNAIKEGFRFFIEQLSKSAVREK